MSMLKITGLRFSVEHQGPAIFWMVNSTTLYLLWTGVMSMLSMAMEFFCTRRELQSPDQAFLDVR